jgi:hypothetical protein
MASNEKKPPRRARRMALAGLLLASIVVGWLLRDCGFGLGPGGGLGFLPGEDISSGPGSGPGEGTASGPPPAPPPIDARPEPCVLHLSSAGLTLGGAPATVEEAVRACRASGVAELSVTTAARAGTYDELKRALAAASVVVNEHRTPADP